MPFPHNHTREPDTRSHTLEPITMPTPKHACFLPDHIHCCDNQPQCLGSALPPHTLKGDHALQDTHRLLLHSTTLLFSLHHVLAPQKSAHTKGSRMATPPLQLGNIHTACHLSLTYCFSGSQNHFLTRHVHANHLRTHLPHPTQSMHALATLTKTSGLFCYEKNKQEPNNAYTNGLTFMTRGPTGKCLSNSTSNRTQTCPLLHYLTLFLSPIEVFSRALGKFLKGPMCWHLETSTQHLP